jgi:hypothetical protein
MSEQQPGRRPPGISDRRRDLRKSGRVSVADKEMRYLPRTRSPPGAP